MDVHALARTVGDAADRGVLLGAETRMQATKLSKSQTSRTQCASDGTVHSIGIAEIEVIKAPDRIRTVLGSCIGIALYDRCVKVGGMAHVILPDSNEGSGAPGKFADTAVDILLERLLEAGAVKARVTAKIVGGAAMFGNSTTQGLGDRNEDAVKARLSHHCVRLAGAAVGGTRGRKMLLDPATGDVVVEVIGEKPLTI